MNFFLLSVVIYLFHVAVPILSDNRYCEYYLADSLIPNSGKGIFFTNKLSKDENDEVYFVLEVSPTISVNMKAIANWRLKNYVFTSNYGHAMVLLGSSMMYNHHEQLRNMEFYWTSSSTEDPDITCNPTAIHMDDYSRCNCWDYVLRKPVEAGTELFVNYGGIRWFESMGIPYNAPEVPLVEETAANGSIQQVAINNNVHSIEYLEKYGICMSRLYVDHSALPYAGMGLYSKTAFTVGELLTISPVLLLPKYEVMVASRNDSAILNYVIAEKGDVAIFSFGLPIMANHQRQSDGLANVYLQWYNTSNDILNTYHPQHFIKDPSTSLYLGLYASKDIQANEELFMDYGVEWEEQWESHLSKVKTHQEGDPPVNGFRFPVYPPTDLIPASWKDIACISIFCENEVEVL